MQLCGTSHLARSLQMMHRGEYGRARFSFLVLEPNRDAELVGDAGEK